MCASKPNAPKSADTVWAGSWPSFPNEQRVSLLAYSYGARIATGALHLLEGGQLSGRALASPDGRAFHVRLVMLAAALHNYWLRPGGYHDMAVSHIDYLLNLYNCCDPVLKRYPLLYKGSRAGCFGFYRHVHAGPGADG